ncbi:hypothetical protein [Demequina iriomotensis]|uniref:hypothetical protein n=1 Tax=Demequina iriomotensis TaxID=1536641 RepID=UPI000781163A|nr:hypothetical protein [Demequina iriomotensis]
MGARRRSGAALAVLALAGGAAAFGMYLLAAQPQEGEPSGRCTAWLDDASATLTAEQAGNAALIAAASTRLGLPARGATIGLATAMQESSLVNLDYGDRDSIGLFQQRPSQGWGTVEEIMDPYYSADTFYRALVKVGGWQDMAVTVAAQTVQRSAFPDAYGNHETRARLWASALRGYSGAMAVDCDVAAGPGTTAAAFIDRVERDFGEGAYQVRSLRSPDGEVWLDVVPAATDDAGRDAFAAWAVAVAATESVEQVADGAAGWTRGAGLGEVEAPARPLGVAVRLLPVTPPVDSR